MLKSNQNKVFWDMEDLNQIQKIAIFPKKGNSYFPPPKNARRSTQTKTEIMIFPKKPPAGQDKQKREIDIFQKKPPAGQHKQRREIVYWGSN